MDERIELLVRRGRRLRRGGEFRKAANAFGELTSIEPQCAIWWGLLADCQSRAGRRDEALKSFRQAAFLWRRAQFFARAEALGRAMNEIDGATSHAA